MPIQIGDMTLYNVKDLAEMLGVSESTIRKYLQQGTLKGKKMARKWYVPDESLQAYFMDLGEGDEQKTPEPAPETQAEQAGAPDTSQEVAAPEGPPAEEESVAPEEPALPEEEPAAPEVVEEAATVQEAGDWRAEVERIRKEIGRLNREAERIEDLYVDPEDGPPDTQP
jgi:excisionase family DNA binding protein